MNKQTARTGRAPASAEGGVTVPDKRYPQSPSEHEAGDAHPICMSCGQTEAEGSHVWPNGHNFIPKSSASSGQRGTSAPAEAGLRDALQYLVTELSRYAAKNGLGPTTLMHALSNAEQVLASAPSASGKEQGP